MKEEGVSVTFISEMKKIEIAYIAGLFDGEGDVGIYPYKATKNGRYYPKLTARIHNTHKQTLEWVRATLGFGLLYRDRIGIKKSGNGAKKQGFVFIVSHVKARKFLAIVKPYLLIKKEKVLQVLTEDESYRNRNLRSKGRPVIKANTALSQRKI